MATRVTCLIIYWLQPCYTGCTMYTLRWRHNGHDCVSNHQPRHCLLNRLFERIAKETSKLRVTGLCVGNSPGTGEFPAQMASNAENVSIGWRHHGLICACLNTMDSDISANTDKSLGPVSIYRLSRYEYLHYKYDAVARLSYSHNGNSSIDKTTLIYWDRPWGLFRKTVTVVLNCSEIW